MKIIKRLGALVHRVVLSPLVKVTKYFGCSVNYQQCESHITQHMKKDLGLQSDHKPDYDYTRFL